MPKLLTIPSRWLTTSHRDVFDIEDAHELLSESDTSNQPVARWARTHGIQSFLSITRLKIVTVLCFTFALLLGYRVFSHTDRERIPGPVDETPQWPWQTYTRYPIVLFPLLMRS